MGVKSKLFKETSVSEYQNKLILVLIAQIAMTIVLIAIGAIAMRAGTPADFLNFIAVFIGCVFINAMLTFLAFRYGVASAHLNISARE